MKHLIIGTSITAALLLTGCSEGAQNEPKTEVNANEKKETAKAKAEPEKKEVKEEISKVEKSEFGEKHIHFTNKNLGISTKLGPINFKLNKVQTSRLKINEGYKGMFEDKDELTLIVFQTDVENTIDDSVNFYPNQAKLTTNTGEQIDAAVVFSDDVGGEFIGKVKKSGNIIFLAESDPKKITNVKFIAEGPSDANFTSLAERYTVEVKTR